MISAISDKISSILNKPIECNRDGIYDYSYQSETQQYFLKFASGVASEVRETEGYQELKEKTKVPKATKIMTGIVDFLKDKLPEDAVVVEIGGGSEGQTRSGKGYQAFRNYYPLDISYAHIKAYTTKYSRQGFVCNAETLPFKNNSIDCVYTNAFLEHPMNPDKVVAEIARVVKPGGIVVHNDAWFCRWWQRHGVYKVLKWHEMTGCQKIIDIAARISELRVLRIPPIVIRRVFKHLFINREERMSYKKLIPNYTLYIGCDEDAAASIDPIDAIRFYESNGFHLLAPLSFIQRMLYPNKNITLVKNK
jgi:ubiquinone/menaquinone biosynthesis C-methylase UbiE